MIQKDYKAIAEKIKKLYTEYDNDPKQSVVAMGKVALIRLSKELADYFEKEDRKRYVPRTKEIKKNYVENTFSRWKFLELCGVTDV